VRACVRVCVHVCACVCVCVCVCVCEHVLVCVPAVRAQRNQEQRLCHLRSTVHVYKSAAAIESLQALLAHTHTQTHANAYMHVCTHAHTTTHTLVYSTRARNI